MAPDRWTARRKGASFCNASAYALDCNTLHSRKEFAVRCVSPTMTILVQALATQCANQTFRNAILPRGSRRDRPIAETVLSENHIRTY